jgi:heparosan-N-sulfate-glucuronate 5-epimerase
VSAHRTESVARMGKKKKGLSQIRQPVGELFDPDQPRGYHLDLRAKADSPAWSRPAAVEDAKWVPIVQYALGCWDRYLSGEGAEWRDAAHEVARYLCDTQEREGPLAGAWRQLWAFHHTFVLHPPWAHAMLQGEAASLLVRVALDTGEERLADAARAALAPLRVPVEEGGVRALLPTGGVLLQEYPTTPPAHVLNGSIFAVLGVYDVAQGLDDERAAAELDVVLRGLLDGLFLWDLGWWSRYDLFPHPLVNVASPFYHDLHIRLFQALERVTDDGRLPYMRRRFEGYQRRPDKRALSLVRKVAFRVTRPRHPIAQRLLDRRFADLDRKAA